MRPIAQRSLLGVKPHLFWPKVAISQHCWLWRGAKNKEGYGQLALTLQSGKRTSIKAHRVAWALAHRREIPDGALVLHRCDIPSCVRPAHLKIGTHSENTRDAVSKGHQFFPPNIGARGASNPAAKLTEADVLKIFHLGESGMTQKDIGLLFGVWQTNISHILTGKRWSHLKRGKRCP